MTSRTLAGGAAALLLGVAGAVGSADVASPERPRAQVDVRPATATGRVVAVPEGGSLQAALEAAQPGDVITLDPGATYTGPFTLPRKVGAGWITVRTGAADAVFPAAGVRVNPSHAGLMPKLVAAAEAVLATAPGAHHYRFIGLEIMPRPGAALTNLVRLGTVETREDDLPHHLLFERCYVHGDPRRQTRRGIALNSRWTAVVDSYLSDFKDAHADSQAVAGWAGSGPFRLENNYLEAAGENVMFGGADPAIADLVPSDIEIRRNHFAKPLAWKMGEPEFAGAAWAVKNLFELKNARRVLIDGNLFERAWAHAQSGFAIVFTVRNQDGRAPWSTVEDVTFVNNVVRHAGAGVNLLGRDDVRPSRPSARLLIANNLFEDIGGPRWGGSGRLFQILDGVSGLVIEHNTALQRGPIIVAEGRPHPGFVFANNIVIHNEYGIIGTGTARGTGTLDAYFPAALVRRNVLVGASAALYPPDNFFPASLDEVGFTDPAGGDYRLTGRYRRAATTGRDVGVDVRSLTGLHTRSTR